MKAWFPAALLSTIMAALPPSLVAQWPLHPPPEVPKGADGKPNLNAPVPRTADGHPDFSGVWDITSARSLEPNGPPPGRPPLVTGGDILGAFKGGLPIQPWAAKLREKRTDSQGLYDPDGNCMPQGPVEYHIDPQPFKIVQTPRQILYISESNYGLRTFYMDGRPLPEMGSVPPYWHGYSVGRWDGNTLVVESNNFHGVDPDNVDAKDLPDIFHSAGWLDHRGLPYTEALKLTERFRRPNFGTLEIEVTVDDAKAFTKPFTFRIIRLIVVDGSEMVEYICHENQNFLKLTAPRR
jgi:hypothetical protein